MNIHDCGCRHVEFQFTGNGNERQP